MRDSEHVESRIRNPDDLHKLERSSEKIGLSSIGTNAKC